MKKTGKKGFTMVELVIVIAVVAILAAVLIPTFISLTRKANDATALADARNLANQMLANLLQRGEEAKDLLVIQQKGEEFYVHAYSVEEARVIAYKANPLSAGDIAATDGVNPADNSEEGTENKFDAAVSQILTLLQSKGAITPVTPAPGAEDWWHPTQMVEIAKTLDFDTNTTCFRADYKINVVAFEMPDVPEGHECSNETLEHFEKKDATCATAGYKEYWMCSVCGKLYSDANATSEIQEVEVIPATGNHSWGEAKQTKAATCTAVGEKTRTCSVCGTTKTETITALGHDFNTALKSDATYHWHKCSRCDATDTKTAHSNLKNYYKQNGKYYGTCTCGHDVELTENNTANLAVYKHAMDLNEILEKDSRNPTMYDAFSFISGNQSKSIKALISAIDTAEGSSGLKIVWDQTIDRFSVVSDSGNTVTVHYTMKNANGLSGTLNAANNESLALWDVYDDTNNIPEYKLFEVCFAYSIYWNGVNAPAKNYMNSDNRNIHAGFDTGEWVAVESFSMAMQASVLNHTSVMYDAIIIRTNGNVTIAIGSSANVKHYGNADVVKVGVYGGQSLNIYEFGTVGQIQKVSEGGDCSKYSIHAMSGSYFGQSKASIEALGCTVVDAGGTFGTN